MATGQVSAGYALSSAKSQRITPVRRIRKETMKLTFKQRIRNWLMDSPDQESDNSMYVEADKFSSDGIRLQIYKASGGYVVETRNYDRRTDRNNTSMHVINDEQNLGDALGKIVMMEALRG